MKLNISNRKKTGKLTTTRKLNNTLLNNWWIKEEIKGEIRESWEKWKWKQNLWDVVKLVLGGKIHSNKYLTLRNKKDLQILYISQIECLWQPCIKQVYWYHLSNNIYSFCVSDNSLNISNFFSLWLFVMVTCDQWSLILPFAKRLQFAEDSRWWLAFFSNKIFF